MKKKTIWIIVILVSAYVICQAIADIGATKLVSIGNVTMPAGTFIFALTFTLRDLLHKRLGKEWARAAIVCAGGMNILQAVYLSFAARLPYPNFYANGEAWASIFSIVPAITAGSIIAEVVSELTDTEIYHAWRTNFKKLPQWSAVLASNLVSLPLDSLIFGLLAFVIFPPLLGGEGVSLQVAFSIVSGQIIWKAIVTLVSMPGIYLVKDKERLSTYIDTFTYFEDINEEDA